MIQSAAAGRAAPIMSWHQESEGAGVCCSKKKKKKKKKGTLGGQTCKINDDNIGYMFNDSPNVSQRQ